jgi:outer membrane protein, heavy metal efflux system
MKRLLCATFIALLLANGALAQDQQHDNMPGMKMPQTSPQNQPPAEPSKPTMPEHEHGMEMEMHGPQDITSNVAGVQEPENPDRTTGSNLPVPDLLQAAKAIRAMTLEEFEALALKNNPTLKEAQAIVRSSAGFARQAGLWPNPSVGYQGEEIRGGSFHGGEQGAFVQQNIVLGGKLGLRRNVFEQQRKADAAGVEEQQLSVRGAVRVQFYSALAQLRIVEVQRKLLDVATDAAVTARELANVGQADAPDVLQAEVEAEQAQLGFARAQRDYIRSYEQLTTVVGDPQMPLALLRGDLESFPAIDPDRYLEDLVANSPTLKRAEQEASRAEAELVRDKHEAIPDLTLRAGAEQNREINELSGRPVGAQGFASASIQIPIFDRNQGRVEASNAELERQREDLQRIKLQLVETGKGLLQQYLVGKLEAERYKTQLIPRAQRAYELYLLKYRNMAAAYPEVIVSQRTLFQLENAYARSLGELWTTAVQLQAYLLVDGLKVQPPGAGSSTLVSPLVVSGETQ